MKRIRSAFITGILVLVPVLATVDIMRWLISFIDRNARKYTTDLFNFHLDFVGLGLLLALCMILLTGILTQNIVGKWVVTQFDGLLSRFPVVGGLYGVIKKFLETVLNPSSDKFNEAVLVEFPQKGNYSVGFRTGTPDAKLVAGMEKKMANIFIPLVPNPTAGFYFLVPEDKITPLDMTVQEAFKVIISMGVVSSKEEVQWTKFKKNARKSKRRK